MLGETRHALATDPLGHAARSGVVQLAPFDLSDTSSVAQRIKTGVAAGDHFGTRPAFLTSDEVASLAGQLGSADAAGKARIADQIAGGFGRHGPHVLAALAGADPVFAQAATLHSAGGQNALTSWSIFEGQDALRSKAVTLPGSSALPKRLFGSALILYPGTRSAMVDAARAIYAKGAVNGDVDPKQIDPQAWARALNLAAGAIYTAQGRLGGFGSYGGKRILLPGGVSQGEFDKLVGRLTNDDLLTLGPLPTHRDGSPAGARDIVHGTFVDVGSGRYAVLTDASGRAALWNGDKPYKLNLRALLPRLRGHDDELR